MQYRAGPQGRNGLKIYTANSVEALLRWPHPPPELIAPVELVPLLEETGLIVRVGARASQR